MDEEGKSTIRKQSFWSHLQRMNRRREEKSEIKVKNKGRRKRKEKPEREREKQRTTWLKEDPQG
jgi:hypothetical protein